MASIKQDIIKGTFYTALAKYSSVLVSLIISAILARLLTPQDFAVATIATLAVLFFHIFSEAGFGAAIIQHQNLTKENLSDIFSFTGYLGTSLFVISFLSADWIGDFYDNSSLPLLCRFLSVKILFATLDVVPNSLMYKNKLFKFISVRTFAFTVGGGVLGICAAFGGLGASSLLIAPVLSAIASFFINYSKYPQKFRLVPKFSSLKKVLSFSVYQLLFYIINFFNTSMDKFIVGRQLSMDSLGYYEKSYRLLEIPISNITSVITPTLLPIFAENKEKPETVLSAYLRIVKLLAFIGFPLSVFLSCAASEIIRILFGCQWESSIPIFQVVALGVGLQMILASIKPIYQSMGAAKALLLMGIITFIIQAIALLIWCLFFKTLISLSWIIVLAFFVNFVQSYYLLFHYVFRKAMITLFTHLLYPVILAIILLPLYYLLKTNLIGFSDIASLLIKFLSMFVFSTIYIQWTGYYDIKKMILKLWRRN